MGTGKRRTPDGHDYLADAIHDLRQPLTALRLDLGGAMAMLSRDPPEVAETLAALRDAIADTEDLQRLLDHLQGRTSSTAAPTVRPPSPDTAIEPPAP